MHTNYRLREGDTVQLLEPARVDGYWYDPTFAPHGCWVSHYILRGSVGKVIRARTPKVLRVGSKSLYFANIDIEHNGVKSRVRLEHHLFKKLRSKSCTA